jgi:hypothetical protein
MNIRDYLAGPTRISKCAPPADAEALKEIHAKTGYEVGPVLRSILIQENGGRARAGILSLPDGSNTVINDVLSATEIIESWRNVADEFDDPSAYIPIMRDGFGHLLVLNRAETLLFYNHDTGTMVDLGLRLEKFPAALRPLPPEPPDDFYKYVPCGVELLERYRALGDAALQAESDPVAVKQLLSIAVYNSDAPLVRVVLARGRRLGDVFRAGAESSFRSIAGNGTREDPLSLLTLFLEDGVDVNATDSRGETALMAAAIGNTPDVVQWLLEHGADPLRTNHRGFTAKREAIAAKRPENAALLP